VPHVPCRHKKAAKSQGRFLELNAGRIHTVNTDGSDRTTIVSDCHLPDGIAIDVDVGHIYWTNMGIPNLNDGSVERADLDGKNRKIIVARYPHSETDHPPWRQALLVRP
jgi:hypothetical protein